MKYLILIVLALAIFALCGCEDIKHEVSHIKSSVIGLNRTVTLYAVDGSPIKVWQGGMKVETETGIARFIYEGKAVIISGTYVIEEN